MSLFERLRKLAPSLRRLTPAEMESVNAFEKTMREKTIPEIVAAVQERHRRVLRLNTPAPPTMPEKPAPRWTDGYGCLTTPPKPGSKTWRILHGEKDV